MNTAFRKIWSRLQSPQHLAEKHPPLLTEQELHNILQLIQRFVSAQKQTLPLLQQRMLGDLASRYLGSGMDYEESRPYQAGDELRNINWRMSARAGEFYTRIFREERKPCVFILFDRRLNMRFATRKRLKASQGLRVAALYALLAQHWHIPVAAMRLDMHGQIQREMTQLKDIMAWLIGSGQNCPTPDETNPEPGLADALHLLQNRINPGSRVILISDFQELQEDNQVILRKMQQKHDLLAIEIRDETEKQLPHAGVISLQSMQDNTVVTLDSNDPVLCADYKHSMQNEQERISKLFRDCGITLQSLSTTQEIEEILQHLAGDFR